jgi:hypothetical protein
MKQTLLTACMSAMVGTAGALVLIESNPPTTYEIHLPLRAPAIAQVPDKTGPNYGATTGQATSQISLQSAGEVQSDVAFDPRFEHYSEGGYALPRAQFQGPAVVVKHSRARQ